MDSSDAVSATEIAWRPKRFGGLGKLFDTVVKSELFGLLLS